MEKAELSLIIYEDNREIINVFDEIYSDEALIDVLYELSMRGVVVELDFKEINKAMLDELVIEPETILALMALRDFVLNLDSREKASLASLLFYKGHMAVMSEEAVEALIEEFNTAYGQTLYAATDDDIRNYAVECIKTRCQAFDRGVQTSELIVSSLEEFLSDDSYKLCLANAEKRVFTRDFRTSIFKRIVRQQIRKTLDNFSMYSALIKKHAQAIEEDFTDYFTSYDNLYKELLAFKVDKDEAYKDYDGGSDTEGYSQDFRFRLWDVIDHVVANVNLAATPLWFLGEVPKERISINFKAFLKHFYGRSTRERYLYFYNSNANEVLRDLDVRAINGYDYRQVLDFLQNYNMPVRGLDFTGILSYNSYIVDSDDLGELYVIKLY